MRRQLPEETPAAAQARAAWLDRTRFEALLDPTVYGVRALEVLQQNGGILGVWVAGSDAYLYPAWQLDLSGRPSPVLQEVLSLLRGPYGVAGGEPTSGWEEMEWLLAPHALLDGNSPRDMLITAPERVLAVARQGFSSWSAEARW
jgi:hypothetical protein